ncbi:MAG TPA: hypothetical protein PLZ84_06655 [Clostridia bacterium]|nr:hypothetical protein [Clostridia bacterium]
MDKASGKSGNRYISKMLMMAEPHANRTAFEKSGFTRERLFSPAIMMIKPIKSGITSNP